MCKTVTLHPDRRVGALHSIKGISLDNSGLKTAFFTTYYTLDFSKPYA
jgi:hypothetical protein